MDTSLLKTLANKHRSSVSKMARRYATTIDTPYGPRKCFEARVERSGRNPLAARFGGIPLRRQRGAVIADRVPVPGIIRHKELVTRLLADRCEICTGTDGWWAISGGLGSMAPFMPCPWPGELPRNTAYAGQ